MKDQDIKVVIPCCKSYEFIFLRDLIRCEGLQNYTRIFLANGNGMISSCNLGTFKEFLKPYDFYSCHKSHLINVKQILRYHKDGQVEMKDHSMVPVSRRRKEDFYHSIIEKIDIRTDHHKIIPLVNITRPILIQN